jgi:sensor domain CHASE-containing protein
MKIDQKIFYISFLALLFFSVGFYLFVPNFAVKTFKSLEESAAIREANNMHYFVGKEIDSLDLLNEEWSRRSDLYDFF